MSPFGHLETHTHSILQVSKHLSFMAVSSVMVASLLSNSLLISSQVSASPDKQLNFLTFNSEVSLDQLEKFLAPYKGSIQPNINAQIQIKVGDYVIPSNLEFDLNDQVKTKLDQTVQTTLDSLKNKEQLKVQKFDRNKLIKDFLALIPDRPSMTLPSEEDLQYYENNGVLPPIKVNEAEYRAKAKELNITNLGHLDPKQKAQFTNARLEDRLAAMTPTEKADFDLKIKQQQNQQQLESELKQLLQTNSESVTTITGISFTGRSVQLNTELSNRNIQSKDGKSLSKSEQDNLSKPKTITKSNLKSLCQKEVLDCVESLIAMDATNLIALSETEKTNNKVKQQEEKAKAISHLTKIKNGEYKDKDNKPVKSQFSQMEAEMYTKEGINVRDYGAEIVQVSRDNQQPKVIAETPKSSWIDSILKVGQVSTQAKGLNNSNAPLIIYANQNQNLSLTFDYNWRTRGKMRTTTGDYYGQRFYFDNGTNQIRLNNSNQCLDVYGGNFTAGAQVYVWDCHSGASQKWFFDEQGRLATLYNKDLCLDSYGGLNWGADLGIWTCHTGSSEEFRAGYNNFGTTMGMTVWSTNSNNETSSFNLAGHTFIEMNSNGGPQAAFSRRGSLSGPNYSDSDCNLYQYNWYGTTRNVNNNICDRDSISVDYLGDWQAILYNNGVWKNTWTQVYKDQWDYAVFGGGYRSNFHPYYGLVDIGGSGTYDFWGYSRSRVDGYNATYDLLGGYYCTSQSLRMWAAYRPNSARWFSLFIISPTTLYNIL